MYDKNIVSKCYSFIFSDDELHNNIKIYNDIIEAIDLFYIKLNNSLKDGDSIYILGSFIDERKYLESDPRKFYIYELQFGISRHVSGIDKDMCIIVSLFDSHDIKCMWQNAWFLVNKIFLNKKLKWVFSDTHIKYYINLNSSKL